MQPIDMFGLRVCNAAKPDGRRYPLSGRPANRRFLLLGIYYRSNFRLLGHLQCIINFNSKVAHSVLQLGMAKKQLNCPKIFCSPVNQGGLGSPH
ncbi:MAG: hypothetical protein HHJ18_00265 [Polaromonas sp.]|nr:hypothetical protein [Polaromonas sp.]